MSTNNYTYPYYGFGFETPSWEATPPPPPTTQQQAPQQEIHIHVHVHVHSDAATSSAPVVSRAIHQLPSAPATAAVAAIPRRVRRAVLVGINYAGSTCPLSGCHNDVANVRAHLMRTLGWHADEIAVLTDDALATSATRPTRANILRAIRNAQAQAAGGDLLFHYSGHGTQVKDTSGDETDGLDEALCPVDYLTGGVITDDEMYAALVGAARLNTNVYAVLDCCHSGSGVDLPYVYGPATQTAAATQLRASAPSPSSAHRVDETKHVLMLSGCRDDQTSADATIAKNQQGALTWALLAALTEVSGVADASGITVITKKPPIQLLDRVRTLLRGGGFAQVPQLSSTSRAWLDAAPSLLPSGTAS